MVLPLLFNRLGPMIGRRREREDSGDEDEPPNKVIILCHCKPFFKFIFLFPSSYTCYQGRRNGSVTFGGWVTTSLEQFQVFRIHCVLSCILFSHFPSPSCVCVYTSFHSRAHHFFHISRECMFVVGKQLCEKATAHVYMA